MLKSNFVFFVHHLLVKFLPLRMLYTSRLLLVHTSFLTICIDTVKCDDLRHFVAKCFKKERKRTKNHIFYIFITIYICFRGTLNKSLPVPKHQHLRPVFRPLTEQYIQILQDILLSKQQHLRHLETNHTQSDRWQRNKQQS